MGGIDAGVQDGDDGRRATRPPMDLGVLLFTLALTLGVAILAGVAPALHAAGENVNETLKEGGRTGTSSRHSQRLRSVMLGRMFLPSGERVRPSASASNPSNLKVNGVANGKPMGC